MITKNSTIKQVFEQKPEQAQELLSPILGGRCVSCPMAEQEKIGEALQRYGLDKEEIKEIIQRLNSG